jgi:hypothetical protein
MHKEYTKRNLLVWNVEGMKNAMALADTKDIQGNDIIITTEKFLTESYDIKGFYGVQTLATSTEGRLAGGCPAL